MRRRRLLRSAVGLAVVAFVLATARLFVFPQQDRPAKVDAIVMFAGSPGRLELAVSLARAGYAPVLAVSQPTPQDACPPDTIPGVKVICFAPHPLTTQGEARWTGQAAAERGWRSIIVITSTPQDTRARLRLSRCYDGDVRIVPVDPSTRADWAYMVTYEWAATIKALVLQRDC
ncbi:MAG: YdcF family protein [Frankia sp.]|nr:YdcF family protein [Frankia sp.]